MDRVSAGRDLSRHARGSAEIEVALIHYSPGQRHSRHEHDHAQVSFLITGGIQETIGRTCHEMTVPAVCIKPTGTDHHDLWGDFGALMLSVRLQRDHLLNDLTGERAKWQQCRPLPPQLILAALTAENEADVDALAFDLLASTADVPVSSARVVPAWIRQAAEAIRDGGTETAADAARIAGVHRVHFSRAFAQHMGMPFSIYRKRVMAARAIDALLRTREPLGDIAAQAGFADQSHMHRAIAAIAATTPRRLRTAFQARRT